MAKSPKTDVPTDYNMGQDKTAAKKPASKGGKKNPFGGKKSGGKKQ